MGKTHRFDPFDENDNATTLSKKELKLQRRQRKLGKEAILDDQMKPDDEDTGNKAW